MATDGVLIETRTVEHTPGGFTVNIPTTWRLLRGVPGAAVTAMAPVEEGEFAANVNVSYDERGKTSPDATVERHVDSLFTLLTDALLIDSEPYAHDLEAHRLLVTYRQGVYGITLEQWLFFVPDRVVVLSAACESSDYDVYADAFTQIASSLIAT